MKNEKDVSVEAFRIIACIFVICIHISLGYYFSNEFSKSALLLACIRADAVAMFWFITGAFYFRNGSYRHMILNLVKRIIIPMIALIFFVQLFEGYLFQDLSISESIYNLSLDKIVEMLKCIMLLWNTPVGHTGQLWYLFTYILVVILFPIEKAFVDYLNNLSKVYNFLVVSFGLLVINDISQNQFAGFSHHTFGAAIPAIIIMIWGHLIYNNKVQIAARVNGCIWLAFFLLVNLCRCLIQSLLYEKYDSPTDTILFWYSSFGLIATICLFMFVYYFCRDYTQVGKRGRIIAFCGGLTFDVYLYHEIVIDLFNKYQMIDRFKKLFYIDGTVGKQILYYTTWGIVVFIVCSIAAIMTKVVKRFVFKLYISMRRKDCRG